MLKRSKWKQYGVPRTEVKGITIHNTSNFDKSAMELFNYLENDNLTSQGCHFLVDDKEVIEVMPEDYAVWHTGKAYDFGNMRTIAIEICSNRDTQTYQKGQFKAITLIKELMDKYSLGVNDIYFHNDFLPNYNCPSTILQMYGDKRNFIEKEFADLLEKQEEES